MGGMGWSVGSLFVPCEAKFSLSVELEMSARIERVSCADSTFIASCCACCSYQVSYHLHVDLRGLAAYRAGLVLEDRCAGDPREKRGFCYVGIVDGHKRSHLQRIEYLCFVRLEVFQFIRRVIAEEALEYAMDVCWVSSDSLGNLRVA
jgi:hypothetical protein